ncbi:MAG: hypothetical protein RL217_449 [Pseudomonadota bacterium]|jgi:A/G-specific adenine glycosylase
MSSSFSQTLLHWFAQHGRKDLPWQKNITPYRVWVSEIMLQQTQVLTVIPYYERFMARFPSLEALASAPIDEVLHHWSGLGYYARARNLHRCAQELMAQYQGEFPRTVSELNTLPGIGRSTAAAIASISMGVAAPILDGNVKRVLTRFYAIEGQPSIKSVENQLWHLAEKLTPSTQTGDYTQAMMDLGATLCTRTRPACGICPLAPKCQALHLGRATDFPSKKIAKLKPVKSLYLLMLQTPDGRFLLEKRPNQGIWGGLWSFPEATSSDEALLLAHKLSTGAITQVQPLPEFRHTFSHYHLDIRPLLYPLQHANAVHESTDNQAWYHPETPLAIGLAAPVRQLLHKEHS